MITLIKSELEVTGVYTSSHGGEMRGTPWTGRQTGNHSHSHSHIG